MKAAKLETSYLLSNPANWRGSYKTNNNYNDSNWTWYKNGDTKLVNFPHITIAFDLKHEVSAAGEWVGFHVSVPIDGGAKNARFNYLIQNGVAKFSNMSKTGLTPEQLSTADDIADTQANLLDELAKAFYDAAVAGYADSEMLVGVKALFATK